MQFEQSNSVNLDLVMFRSIHSHLHHSTRLLAENSLLPLTGLEVKWHNYMKDSYSTADSDEHRACSKVLTDLCNTWGCGQHWPRTSSLPLFQAQNREEFSASLSHSGARCLFVPEGPCHLRWALPDARHISLPHGRSHNPPPHGPKLMPSSQPASCWHNWHPHARVAALR